jgi:uncharacterized protein (DUF924 family)
MMSHRTMTVGLVAIFAVLAPSLVTGEVTRVEITTRRDVLGGRSFGSSGPYEHIVGRLHFAVDPSDVRNRVIVDLDKAPRNGAGRVEFSADLEILRPREAGRGNSIALIDVVNRGNKVVLRSFNKASGAADPATESAYGDGFLLRRGFTIVWVGWEFDVVARAGAVRISVPSAEGTNGLVRATFVPNTKDSDLAVGDLAGYTPADPTSPQNTLSVRERRDAPAVTIPRDKWRLNGNVVTLDGGFVPGRTYEVAYAAANAPIGGLGFAAFRDTGAWIKYAPDAVASAKHAIAFGSSQSGRFLRNFLYLGFNADERNRHVFDAVLAHIAGASRIDLNRRWSTPTSLGSFAATSFPFADASLRDPVSNVEEGTLDNSRARDHQPKIFYTNTGVEYWGGARAAALVHTSPDGSKDLTLPDNVRVYFFAGTQHGPATFPPTVTAGEQEDNPTDYWWAMRALLVAMERWVLQSTAPPPSRYPRLQDGSLVRGSSVAFPTLPGVSSPRKIASGARAPNPLISGDGAPGTALPLLVPQVDRDGNERSGIRLPEVAVPLATYTGWNFRNSAIGASDQLFPLLGSYVPFVRTKAERERVRDPRLSIAERYSTRERYLTQIQEAAETLTKEGYLLAEDVPAIVRRAADHWDLLARRPDRLTARR